MKELEDAVQDLVGDQLIKWIVQVKETIKVDIRKNYPDLKFSDEQLLNILEKELVRRIINF